MIIISFDAIMCVFAVAEGNVDHADGVDPYDLIDPVEILSKLPSDFYDKMVWFVVYASLNVLTALGSC